MIFKERVKKGYLLNPRTSVARSKVLSNEPKNAQTVIAEKFHGFMQRCKLIGVRFDKITQNRLVWALKHSNSNVRRASASLQRITFFGGHCILPILVLHAKHSPQLCYSRAFHLHFGFHLPYSRNEGRIQAKKLKFIRF